MGVFRWVLGGIIGATAGILIWVLVGYYTGCEVGWIAWGVGFLVGVGVRYAAYLSDQEESSLQGFIAAGIALGSILLAKFLVFTLVTGEFGIALDVQVTDHDVIADFAHRLVEEKVSEGETISWPPDVVPEEAYEKDDFPPEIWSEAEKRWNDLSSAEQDAQRQKWEQVQQMILEKVKPKFIECFSIYDALWFGLAVITAYKIGIGTYGTD